jgi:hypothetical protein
MFVRVGAGECAIVLLLVLLLVMSIVISIRLRREDDGSK